MAVSLILFYQGANLQGARMICCNGEGCSMKGCNFDDPSGIKANMEGWFETFLLLKI